MLPVPFYFTGKYSYGNERFYEDYGNFLTFPDRMNFFLARVLSLYYNYKMGILRPFLK